MRHKDSTDIVTDKITGIKKGGEVSSHPRNVLRVSE